MLVRQFMIDGLLNGKNNKKILKMTFCHFFYFLGNISREINLIYQQDKNANNRSINRFLLKKIVYQHLLFITLRRFSTDFLFFNMLMQLFIKLLTVSKKRVKLLKSILIPYKIWYYIVENSVDDLLVSC